MQISSSRLPIRFLPTLLLAGLLSLTACNTVLGWFGRDESDRNQQSFSSKRAPSANPNGSDPTYVDGTPMKGGTKKDAAQTAEAAPSSDNPYDMYDAKGGTRRPAAQGDMAASNNNSGGWFSHTAAKDAGHAERRRPVENVQAEMGIDGSTAMAAPIAPIDLGAPSNAGSLSTPAPLPERAMSRAEPAPMTPLPAYNPNLPPTKELAAGEYPRLGDTPSVPPRIEAFRKDRQDSKTRMASLSDEQRKADMARTELLSESGTGPAAATAMPANLPELEPAPARPPEPELAKRKPEPVQARPEPIERIPEPEPMLAERAPMDNPPQPVMAEAPTEPKTGISGWFNRNFRRDTAKNTEEQSLSEPMDLSPPAHEMARSEPLHEMRKNEAKPSMREITPGKRDEKEFAMPAATEEEPIVLRPPPEIRDTPEMEPSAEPDDFRNQEGFALKAPTAMAQTRFLADSRYAARRSGGVTKRANRE